MTNEKRELIRMLRKAKLAGADRVVSLLEGQLADLERPKPQHILDCEEAAELSAIYRRSQAQKDGSTLDDIDLPELAPPMSKVLADVRATQAELNRLGIRPGKDRPQ